MTKGPLTVLHHSLITNLYSWLRWFELNNLLRACSPEHGTVSSDKFGIESGEGAAVEDIYAVYGNGTCCGH